MTIVFDGRGQCEAKDGARRHSGGPQSAPLIQALQASRSKSKEQPWKALSPMLVRPAGSAIDVIEEQPPKAHPPMLVRPAGSSIDVIEEQ